MVNNHVLTPQRFRSTCIHSHKHSVPAYIIISTIPAANDYLLPLLTPYSGHGCCWTPQLHTAVGSDSNNDRWPTQLVGKPKNYIYSLDCQLTIEVTLRLNTTGTHIPAKRLTPQRCTTVDTSASPRCFVLMSNSLPCNQSQETLLSSIMTLMMVRLQQMFLATTI